MSDREHLEDVYEAYRGDKAFDHLRTEGIVLVPGDGSSRPRILIVGEAPGAVENTQRKPFVGASGRALRSCITDVAGLTPADYFITNTVKYRPPGNRTPEPAEIQASKPYLRREWSALGRPPVLVAVGGTAWAALRPAEVRSGILGVAGHVHGLPGGVALWPMIHPAYGLRNAKARPLLEQHWQEFGNWFREEFK